MAKTGKAYPGEVRTWIAADDLVKFKQIARARGLKDVELAREFILNGLAVQDADLRNRLESEYAQQLRVSTAEITGVIKTNGKDPGQKPYRFLKAIRKSNFMSVSPPRSACLLAKVA